MAIAVDEDFSFRFCCDPRKCSLACCHGHAIALSPYEVLRIRGYLRLSSEELEERYLLTHYDPSGLPLLMLSRDPCPFLKRRRCSIYPARPLACRLFPLGRLCDGEVKTIFMDDACCPGIGKGERLALGEYIAEQGAEEYLQAWERWVGFVEAVEAAKLSSMQQVFLKILLYNFDLLPKGAEFATSPEEQFLARLALAEELISRMSTEAK
jgi:hypothetical protein